MNNDSLIETLEYARQWANHSEHYNPELVEECEKAIDFLQFEVKRGEICVVDKALAQAAEILANFKAAEPDTDGTLERKLEEWQACYAKLFTQMTQMAEASHKSVSASEIRDNEYRLAHELSLEKIQHDYTRSKLKATEIAYEEMLTTEPKPVMSHCKHKWEPVSGAEKCIKCGEYCS